MHRTRMPEAVLKKSLPQWIHPFLGGESGPPRQQASSTSGPSWRSTCTPGSGVPYGSWSEDGDRFATLVQYPWAPRVRDWLLAAAPIKAWSHRQLYWLLAVALDDMWPVAVSGPTRHWLSWRAFGVLDVRRRGKSTDMRQSDGGRSLRQWPLTVFPRPLPRDVSRYPPRGLSILQILHFSWDCTELFRLSKVKWKRLHRKKN